MPDIHPAIRIICFVVLTASLSLGHALNIAIAAAILGFFYWHLHAQAWPATWRLLRRMRWFFLSIAIIYLWLTPGQPLFPEPSQFAAWMPTAEGLTQGVLRVAALILMVAAASLLLQSTPRDQILAAIRWLLTPLGILGFPHERFAVRVTLTLAVVSQMQNKVRDVLAVTPSSAKPWSRIGEVAATLFAVTLQEADQAPCVPIEVPNKRPPPPIQWVLPVLLFAVMSL